MALNIYKVKINKVGYTGYMKAKNKKNVVRRLKNKMLKKISEHYNEELQLKDVSSITKTNMDILPAKG